MANNAARPPKINPLTTSETFTTFTNWQQTLIYTLGLDNRFTPLMRDDAVWEDGDSVDHGFVADVQLMVANADGGPDIPDPNQVVRTAADKVRTLHLMLGQIANYCNVIARHQIIYESTSLDSIWDMIREHYGFNVTGQRFLDLTAIRLRPGEKPADLYQRLVCFFTDNLFTRASRLTHKGRAPLVDEKLTPTIQNTIVLLWLERVHVGLPGLVKQRYGTELRNRTLASLKSEIANALDSMLEELNSATAGVDSRVMRLPQPSRFSNNNNQSRFPNSTRGSQYNRNSRMPQRRDNNGPNPKLCSLCKTANISGWDTHYLSQCKHISDRDRKMLSSSSRVRQTEVDDYDDVEYDEFEEVCDTIDNGLFIDNPPPASFRRVTTRKSPHMACFYNHYPVQVCLDPGSESNLVSQRFASHAGVQISTQGVHQGAVQADANSRLDIVGEVKNVTLRRGSHVFTLDALVTKQDVGDIIAGEPFLEQNDIAVRSAKKQIIIRGNEIISYSSAADSTSL